MKNIKVNINGEERLYPEETLIKNIADVYQKDYTYRIIAALKDGKICELNKRINKDCSIDFITVDTVTGHNIYVRGVQMLLLKAVYEIYSDDLPESFNIESSIGNGYYCEIKGVEPLSEYMLKKIENLMQTYVKMDIPFVKSTLSTDDAIKLFEKQGMKQKERLFMYRRASTVNIYDLLGYKDYFYGAMPASTGILEHFELKLYKDGFVFVVPSVAQPDVVSEFKGSPKLYNVIKESNEWIAKMHADGVGALNDSIVSGRFPELVLIQEALHEKRIGDIAQAIYDRNDVKFVMIAGPSSSGKTTFSHRLSVQLKTLGIMPHPIALDNYFVNREDTPKNEDGTYNYECLEAIDTKQFNEDMLALMDGQKVRLPRYNFITGKREYEEKEKALGKDDILVIEGIHGLNDKLSYLFPVKSKYKIYISALTQLNIDEHNRIPTTDGRLIRRIVRDARTTGADAADTIAMWNTVRNGENKNIFPFQEDADIIFNSALIYELAILKQYAEPLLFKVDRKSPEYIEAKRLLKFLDYFICAGCGNVPNNSILREFIGGSTFQV